MQSNSQFIESMNQFILANQLIRQGEKIIVAVSGGIDSTVLLDTLYKLKDRWKLSLALIHLNHQLRGRESDEDEDFIRQIGKNYGIDCYIERVNTTLVAESKKLSLQEAARNLRYNFFSKVRASSGFSKIAIGHNADDNAETMLINIFRGAGVHGLTGIPVSRADNGVIRPLLFASRLDIETYALENRIPYRVDSSNLKTDYLRNYIRLKLLPTIRENINPNISATLGRTGILFSELEEFLAEEVRRQLPEIIIQKLEDEEIVIDLDKLHSKPAFLQEHFLNKIAKDFIQAEISFTTVRAIHKTTKSETGTACSIKSDIVFYKDRNRGVFKHIRQPKPFRYEIQINNSYDLDKYYFSSEFVDKAKFDKNPAIEFIDADLLSDKLILRNWREGDWFLPFGMKGKKKISDFFIDEKIPIFKKNSIPILESNGDIIWVCGLRLDDRFKITNSSKRILKLTFNIKNNPT